MSVLSIIVRDCRGSMQPHNIVSEHLDSALGVMSMKNSKKSNILLYGELIHIYLLLFIPV